jgi:hypothetical protein
MKYRARFSSCASVRVVRLRRTTKASSQYIFALKMATIMLVETLDISQHSTQLTSESLISTLNSNRESLRTKLQRDDFTSDKFFCINSTATYFDCSDL